MLIGGSLAALVAASPAFAQDSGQAGAQAAPPSQQTTSPADQAASPDQSVTNSIPTTADVVVTGLRGSLQRNLDIKRDSPGVVDAISAEDIGKFPDSNVAAALQRVPGVSISRGTTSLGGLPATTGDATGISVRGFGPAFNETLFDGRLVPTATGNRGFDFSTIGADFVGEVDVLKTPDAALSAGAIGATINTKYPKPFDHPGFRLAATGAGSINDNSGKPAGSGGLLVSDTNGDDTFGVLADFAYSQHRTETNHINNQGQVGTHIAPCQLKGSTAATCTPTAPGTGIAASDAQTLVAFYPQDYGIYREDTTDSRIDGRIALQWKPADNLVLTVNDDFSREKVHADQYGFSVWFNGPSLTQVQLDKNGTATSFIQPSTPTDFQGQQNQEVLMNNEIGGNVNWTISPHFQMEFDGDHADAWLNPNGQLSSIDADVGYGGPNATNLQFINAGSNVLPTVANYGPGGNTSQLIGNGIIGSHVLPISSTQNHDGLDQVRVQGTWSQDNLKIRFGGQYIADRFRLRSYTDFVNNDWQAYSGYGPASGSATGIALPQSFFTGSFSTANFIPGYSGNLPPNILAFSPYTVLNYLQGLGNPQAKNIPGFNYPGNTVPSYTGTYDIVSDPGSYQNINEYTIAGFLTMSFKTQLGDMPFNVNLGVREESTTTHSGGLGRLPTSLVVQSGDKTALAVAFTGTQPVETRNHYQYLLPNIDLNLDVTDKLKVRFDASRTLTRPALNLLTPVQSIPNGERVGSLVGTGGNPTLSPYLSDNLDLGAEWYYHSNSYFAVDGFLKQVSNFIVGGSTTQTINGVVDPTTGQVAQFVITQQVNGPSATVRGVEVAWQQVFGNTGFGFQANTTIVGTNKPYDPSNLAISGFAVTGLADSANFVGFYDKHGFQARVAVNWRDEYLDHFGQQQNNSVFGTEPTFVKSSTQVDFSSSYDLNKHVNVFFEALNLNGAVLATHGRYSNQLLDVFKYGRRFTVGVHFRY
ncbi:MAG: TonB-dependent receptor [Janthinobacterium lividum]